jgi:hypothetical protein
LNKRSYLARISPYFGFAILVPSKLLRKQGVVPHGCFFVRIPMESKRKAERSKETTSLRTNRSNATSLHSLIGGLSDALPLALTATRPGTPSRRAHGPPYSGSRRLLLYVLNTSEGFQSAARVFLAFMGIPRSRSNEEGGAVEGYPAPGPASRSIVSEKCT